MNVISKKLTEEDVIQNKKEAIKNLNAMLESLIGRKDPKYLKKASLISYWIKDYTRMLNFEEKFNPAKNIAYKRGDIVKVNFGFKIGAEYGGLHYGVILDKHNPHNSPVATVIPLTSIKNGKSIHNNNVCLGNELFEKLNNKLNKIIPEIEHEQIKIASKSKKLESELLSLRGILHRDPSKASEYSNKIDDLEQMFETIKQQALFIAPRMDEAQKLSKELSKMKQGSVAIINQITTISKIRIIDPKNNLGVLHGISLSAENMNRINDKVKELFMF